MFYLPEFHDCSTFEQKLFNVTKQSMTCCRHVTQNYFTRALGLYFNVRKQLRSPYLRNINCVVSVRNSPVCSINIDSWRPESVRSFLGGGGIISCPYEKSNEASSAVQSQVRHNTDRDMLAVLT